MYRYWYTSRYTVECNTSRYTVECRTCRYTIQCNTCRYAVDCDSCRYTVLCSTCRYTMQCNICHYAVQCNTCRYSAVTRPPGSSTVPVTGTLVFTAIILRNDDDEIMFPRTTRLCNTTFDFFHYTTTLIE